jgi:hypothetical protein
VDSVTRPVARERDYRLGVFHQILDSSAEPGADQPVSLSISLVSLFSLLCFSFNLSPIKFAKEGCHSFCISAALNTVELYIEGYKEGVVRVVI